MSAHLNSGKLNLGILRESYRRELLECLDKCSGSKAIVWDNELTGPFGLISEYSILKEHEVDQMFPLKMGRLPSSNVTNIVFLTRPRLDLMEIIADNVKKATSQSAGFPKDFHIFFVPKRTVLCEKKLERLGVRGNFTYIEEICLDIIPLDADLLSMEAEDSYKECILHGDMTSMFYAAKALMTIQSLYGIIPNIYGKGHCARHVCDIILRMRRELAGSEPQITPQIDNLLLIDRSVDPLTPLLTPLTYEALIDEIYGISYTSVKLPPEKFATSSQQGSAVEAPEFKKIALNSGEEMFAELRDKNFNAVGQTLSRKAKVITQQFDERHQAKTVGQIKEFVSKLPHMQVAKQSLATHTSIAELVKEKTSTEEFLESLATQQQFVNGIDTDKANAYIEDCIARQEPLLKILRLLCIQCITNNGFKQKLLDYYKREIIQTYGYEQILTLLNLEKVGLLKIQDGKNAYQVIKKTLKLVVEEVNEQNPNDVAYVFSGLAPLSIRLTQFLARPGWRSITEILQNYLPGPTFEEIQQVPVGLRKRKSSISSSSSSAGEKKVTLVFFLGGATYAEIAALKFLSGDEDGSTEYVIATTQIISGDKWMSSLSETLHPPVTNPF